METMGKSNKKQNDKVDKHNTRQFLTLLDFRLGVFGWTMNEEG
jgi:hypothetical protein